MLGRYRPGLAQVSLSQSAAGTQLNRSKQRVTFGLDPGHARLDAFQRPASHRGLLHDARARPQQGTGITGRQCPDEAHCPDKIPRSQIVAGTHLIDHDGHGAVGNVPGRGSLRVAEAPHRSPVVACEEMASAHHQIRPRDLAQDLAALRVLKGLMSQDQRLFLVPQFGGHLRGDGQRRAELQHLGLQTRPLQPPVGRIGVHLGLAHVAVEHITLRDRHLQIRLAQHIVGEGPLRRSLDHPCGSLRLTRPDQPPADQNRRELDRVIVEVLGGFHRQAPAPGDHRCRIGVEHREIGLEQCRLGNPGRRGTSRLARVAPGRLLTA